MYGSPKNTVTYLVDESDGGKFHFDHERQLRVRVHNVLLDLINAKQIKRRKFEGQYLYLALAHKEKIGSDQANQLKLYVSAYNGSINPNLIPKINLAYHREPHYDLFYKIT